MRPLSELINRTEPAWPMVSEWINSATNAVEVLPASDPDRATALVDTQVTTRSPMGAVIHETGGLLLDGGWLRILGSGHPRLPRSLPGWNQGKTMHEPGVSPSYLLVADDAVGGFFAINGGGLGPEPGMVFYFAPDSLQWENLDLGYSDFLWWCLQGNLAGFYQDLRWPGWEAQVASLGGNQVIGFYPFLFAEGPPLEERHRDPLPIAEVFRLYVDDKG